MRLQIEHVTEYRYSEPLTHAIQTLRLTPRSSARQQVESWSVAAEGATLHDSVDGHGNLAHLCTLRARAAVSTVRAQGTVLTHAQAEVQDDAQQPPPWVYLRPTPLAAAHEPLYRFARAQLGLARPSVGALVGFAEAVRQHVRYSPGCTGVHTTAPQAFDQGQGVCQDQAHVFIAACRSLGLAARYVSGYFYAPEAPALASHAWAEVCIDLAARRWLGVDVTHGCLVDERHVCLALGPDYGACAPVRGVRHGGGDEAMAVRVSVTPT